MAVILLAVLAVAVARPEAPLDRRYLRANPAPVYGPPAPRYGPPGYESGKPVTEDPLAAVILLAVLAVAVARPEAPLDSRYRSANPAPVYGPPAPKYGPPGYQSAAPVTEDPLAEPASYKFAYKVQDEEAGLDFGHEEAREGDEATGEYRVLLPDGRTLIVTYIANNDGYQPEIRYEEAKVRNGY
ncbi:hypothetical protein J437_LFUL006310 [Ladona fulva]|uniref:Pro-resilin n=1 Tax=Ladona fulva TaxID=123851 RepID=A0A8K0K0X9_LADFU|nr:hypothetical protein J437_LFUL006310 [Ladona fulva]